MAMTAKDSIEFRKLLGNFAVFLITAVGEEEDGIAVMELVNVLLKHFIEGNEM